MFRSIRNTVFGQVEELHKRETRHLSESLYRDPGLNKVLSRIVDLNGAPTGLQFLQGVSGDLRHVDHDFQATGVIQANPVK